MVVNCEQVWNEISNYLDDEVDAATRAAMEAHFRTASVAPRYWTGRAM